MCLQMSSNQTHLNKNSLSCKTCCHKYPSATPQKIPSSSLSLKRTLFFTELCGLFWVLLSWSEFHRENRKARTFSLLPLLFFFFLYFFSLSPPLFPLSLSLYFLSCPSLSFFFKVFSLCYLSVIFGFWFLGTSSISPLYDEEDERGCCHGGFSIPCL